MGREPALSPFDYFGGKARMREQIVSMLDYSCDTYVEPFGGAARVLLAKDSHHKFEIYNEANRGLASLFHHLSVPKKADELISELYGTEYSEQEFRRALDYLNDHYDMGFDYIKKGP